MAEAEKRNCQNCKNEFVIEPEDFQFYKKMEVPPPTFCSECRMKRRFIFWNQNNLFRKKEAINGKEIFSTYPQEANIIVYDHDYWWSDAWDVMNYGKDVDFSRPFLGQIQELNTTVPWPSKSVQRMVNSDYCNQASRNKNCYLCFNGNDSEDSAYGIGFTKMRTCFDFLNTNTCELSYELFWADNCYQCFYCIDSGNCRNVWFSRNCQNCQDCIGCVGLRNMQYCISNEQYTKEEYTKRLHELNLGSYTANRTFYKLVQDLWQRIPVKYMHGFKNVNVLGEYIENSKNIKYCFELVNCEDMKYSQNIDEARDSYDYTNWGLNSELIYDSVSIGENCRNIKFSFDCWPNCTDLEYCLNCHSSSNLFGCVGLRSKQYCILNKQYSKEDYFVLREKIISHMNEQPYADKKGILYKYGEMFPPEFSPLAYTEATIGDYYPIKKNEAVAQGFLWRDPNMREFQTTISSEKIPDHIRDISGAITQELIGCGLCKRAYRIIPSELEFYQRFSLPISRLCHVCRYRERLKFRNQFIFYKRTCDCGGEKSSSGGYKNNTKHFHGGEKCLNAFETTYSPEVPDIIYCEQCYQQEMA